MKSKEDWVFDFANGIANNRYNLANGLFNAEYIVRRYENKIWQFLKDIGVTGIEDIDWDQYDNSLELLGCVDGFTMTKKQLDALREQGFFIVYVNYKNGPHLYGDRTASMNAMPVISEENFLISDIKHLEEHIPTIPEDAVLTRMSLEAKLKDSKERLANLLKNTVDKIRKSYGE